MSENHVYGGAGSTGSIHFYMLANSPLIMANVTVSGNVSVSAALTASMYIRAAADNSQVNNTVISGNIFRSTGDHAVFIFADGATSQIADVILTGNIIKGGATANVGISAPGGNVVNVIEDNNIMTGAAATFDLSGSLSGLQLKSLRHAAPLEVSASSFTWGNTDAYVVNNAGTCTVTLPSAARFTGRELSLQTVQAQAVVSATSNVIPVSGGAAGTAILPATDGAWVTLKSTGTAWRIVAQ